MGLLGTVAGDEVHCEGAGPQAKKFTLDSTVREDSQQLLNPGRGVIKSGLRKGQWHNMKHGPHI